MVDSGDECRAMQAQSILLGSIHASPNWVDLGPSDGEYFSLYSEFDNFPYDASRVAYIREVFGENQYSARWIKFWLRNKEFHLFCASEFAGIDRGFQLRTAWTSDFRVDFYEVSIAASSSGVDGGIYA